MHHSAGPDNFLNGGIISTVIDCHGIGTAIAKAYQMEGRPIGQGDFIWYVTGGLNVTFKRPVAIQLPVTLLATVEDVQGRKMKVRCSLRSEEKECAVGEVLAVRVPPEWSAH